MKKSNHLEGNRTYEDLIKVTLDLIDKKGGSKNVNLREIAKQLGFAHTNTYNYFSSYEDLLWTALLHVLGLMVQNTQSRVKPEQIEEEGYLSKFVEAHIDFGLSHPGWYHFIWLDQLKDTAAKKETVETFENLERRFVEIIYASSKKRLTWEEASEAGVIIHGYLHGEICKLIGGRYLEISEETYKRRINANVHRLIESLVDSRMK